MTSTSLPRPSRELIGFVSSVRSRLIDGLRCRLRNLPRLLVCVKRTCSPSYSNHIGLTWTVSSGRIVPSAPKSARESSGRREEDIAIDMSQRPSENRRIWVICEGEVVVADQHERL